MATNNGPVARRMCTRHSDLVHVKRFRCMQRSQKPQEAGSHGRGTIATRLFGRHFLSAAEHRSPRLCACVPSQLMACKNFPLNRQPMSMHQREPILWHTHTHTGICCVSFPYFALTATRFARLADAAWLQQPFARTQDAACDRATQEKMSPHCAGKIVLFFARTPFVRFSSAAQNVSNVIALGIRTMCSAQRTHHTFFFNVAVVVTVL